jgi:dephospho-CoA kinase
MAIFAVTGDFCSGKTTLLRALAKKGALIFNADKLVHGFYRDHNGEMYKKVANAFPGALSGKNISRKKLAAIVFSDGQELLRLENIVHAQVIKAMKIWIKQCPKAKIALAEVPLLFEKKLEKFFTGVILVKADHGLIVKRASLSRKASPQDVEKRFKRFLPINKKILSSRFVIENNGDKSEFNRSIATLWQGLKKVQLKEV